MSEQLLFPEHEWDYVDRSVERVKLAWGFHHMMNPNGEKMLLAFSGGKDSVCLFFVCKQAAEEMGVPMEQIFHVQYNVTTLDPPELVYFIRDLKKTYPFIEMKHPQKTMWKLIVENGTLPTMVMRYCCRELKESSHLSGGYTLTGVRRAESIRRRERGEFEIHGAKKAERILLNDNEDRRESEYCMQKSAYICNPIIDWSDDDVWHYIKGKNLPYCKLYDEGFSRLGCIGCPMATPELRKKQLERWPGYRKLYIRACEKVVANGRRKTDETGIEMFEWWLSGKFRNSTPQKETLF